LCAEPGRPVCRARPCSEPPCLANAGRRRELRTREPGRGRVAAGGARPSSAPASRPVAAHGAVGVAVDVAKSRFATAAFSARREAGSFQPSVSKLDRPYSAATRSCCSSRNPFSCRRQLFRVRLRFSGPRTGSRPRGVDRSDLQRRGRVASRAPPSAPTSSSPGPPRLRRFVPRCCRGRACRARLSSPTPTWTFVVPRRGRGEDSNRRGAAAPRVVAPTTKPTCGAEKPAGFFLVSVRVLPRPSSPPHRALSRAPRIRTSGSRSENSQPAKLRGIGEAEARPAGSAIRPCARVPMNAGGHTTTASFMGTRKTRNCPGHLVRGAREEP